MNSATQTRTLLCATCGEPEDGRTGLCLACLMRSATDPERAEAFDIFADETELPRIGSYELLDEIGRGGMGLIYRARQLHTGRLVAVKILQSHIAHQPELLARFRREAQTAARLDHPHVLPIYEVNDEADGVPFFTMKLAVGGSLVERRAALRGRFREIAALLAKVARAADHAHQRGVLHRDLKPGNILFDAEGEPMVSDFGLAAWLHQESDLTRTIAVFGTPGYLPPEYLHGRPEVLSPASDIYSLGVILFELLAGRLPFPAATSLAEIRAAADRPAPPLRKVVPQANRDLEVICARCLEIEPGLRYRSAGALAGDLERWLDGRPIIARPTPLVVHAWKLARRHPSVSIASAACLFLAAAGIVQNSGRRQTEAKLARATAYDRTVAFLPIKDLDALDDGSPLALEALQACMEGLRGMKGLAAVVAKTVPEPLPRHGELMRLSQAVGGRYLLSATVRRREASIRLVIHIIDAAEDTTVHKEVIESTALSEPAVAQGIQVTLSGIKDGWAEALGPAGRKILPTSLSDTSQRLAASYILAGRQHLTRHTVPDTELAIEAFQKAVKAQPESAAAMAELANAMAFRSAVGDRKNWLDKALSMARHAVEKDPLLAEAHRTLSYIYSLKGEVQMALDHALQAFELEPDEVSSANIVAETMCNLGALDRALVWNRKVEQRQNSPGNCAYYRGDYLAALGEFEQAKQACREFMEFRPELPDGPLALANVYLLEGKVELAMKEIRSLLVRFPTHTLVLQTCACMEFVAGDPTSAEKLFDDLTDDDAGLTTYLSVRRGSALGYLALSRGDPAGRALVEQSLQLDEERLGESQQDASILFEKAANLCVLGRTDEALYSLRRATVHAQWVFFQMKLDPRVESLRDNREFDEIFVALEKKFQEMKANYHAIQPHQP